MKNSLHLPPSAPPVPPKDLSELLKDFKEGLESERVSVRNIMDTFEERGFAFFLFIFGLTVAIPIPLLGIQSLLSLLMLVLCAQQLAGRYTVWLPEFMLRWSLRRSITVKILDKCAPWVDKMELYTKPRMRGLTHRPYSIIVPLTGIIMLCCVILPLPLTNTIPGLGLVAMAIGLLVRDGLAIIVGSVIGTLWSFGCFYALYYAMIISVEIIADAPITDF